MLPLENVRVLDLTTTFFGPLTSQVLGDYGADVIKIEAPGGDPVRNVGPGKSPGMSSAFHIANRNKRSIVLDLKQPAAADALWQLIDSADIFVHNMRPQKIVDLGFGPDAVRAQKPGLIYAGLHGYRASGPYADRPAYDDVIQGESGVAALFAERDGEPAMVPASFVDKTSAIVAASGIVAAYVKRLRTGEGGYFECSMFEAMVNFNLIEHQHGSLYDSPEGKAGYPRVLTPHRKPQKTKDGYICLLAYTDRQWQSFWRVVERPELAEDPRFKLMAQRSENFDALYGAAAAEIARHTTAHWLDVLTEAQIPVGQVNSLDDLRDDPHLREIGFFRPFNHETEGLLHVPDTACQFDGESLPIRSGAPRLGADSEAVLREVGMSTDDIASALRIG